VSNCPLCGSANHRVVNTRAHALGISRRRQCGRCGRRWNTIEVSEEEILSLQRIREAAKSIVSLIKEEA